MRMRKGLVPVGFLKTYFRRYAGLFFTAIAFLSLEACCDLMQPAMMSKIVDIGIKSKNLGLVLRFGGEMLLIAGAGACAAVTRNVISSNVSQRFGALLRGDLYRKIHGLSFDRIDHYDTASLVTRLTNDVTQMQNFVNGMMRIFVKAPLLCVGSIVMASLLDWQLTLVILAVVPVIGVLIYLNTKVGFPLFRKVQGAVDGVNGVMREYLSGIRVVKAFNRSALEEERFSGVNEGLSSIQTKAMRTMAVFSPGISLSVNLGIVAVLWFGGIRVNGGSLQVGRVIAFVNYMTQILSSFMMISMVFTNFVRAKASWERIEEVMSDKSSIRVPEHPPEPEGDGIEFDHVGFSYGGEDVLHDVNLTCGEGETVGIIGTTGAGKSTLVSLIPRFYDVTSGTLRVGGVDVRRLDDAALRGRIALVPQKNVLFSGTILENIRWGKPDASPDEVRKAASAAQADGFITGFRQGYDTMLGQGGVNLSGGQKQRISIARALVKKPEILILDDCTSAVDVITEAAIRSALREYSENLLCLIISQRVSSVISADKIVVMDNGRIVGEGTHRQLMESCGVYREIYLSQYGEDGGLTDGQK